MGVCWLSINWEQNTYHQEVPDELSSKQDVLGEYMFCTTLCTSVRTTY